MMELASHSVMSYPPKPIREPKLVVTGNVLPQIGGVPKRSVPKAKLTPKMHPHIGPHPSMMKQRI